MRLLSQGRGGLEAAKSQERKKRPKEDSLPPTQARLQTGGGIKGCQCVAAAGADNEEDSEQGKDADLDQPQGNSDVRRDLDAEEGQGECDRGKNQCVDDPPVRPE